MLKLSNSYYIIIIRISKLCKGEKLYDFLYFVVNYISSMDYYMCEKQKSDITTTIFINDLLVENMFVNEITEVF